MTNEPENPVIVGKTIAAALVKAQAGYGRALKSSENPHYKSAYADLSSVVEAVTPSLNANGIAFMQRSLPSENGVTIETLFIHTCGETMSGGPLHVPVQKNDAQGYGSALTYARRYSLMAACGIAPEDDDGHAASVSKPAYKAASAPIKAAAKPATQSKAISDRADDIPF
jgi:hypothetical protein